MPSRVVSASCSEISTLYVEHALRAVEAQRLEHLRHLALAVRRDNADRIAGRVCHALFELQLDMNRLFFALRPSQALVRNDARDVRLIAGVLAVCALAGASGAAIVVSVIFLSLYEISP